MHNNVVIKEFAPENVSVMQFNDKDEYENIMKTCPYYFDLLPQMCEGNVFSVYKNNQIIYIFGWIPSFQNFCQITFFASENLHKEFDKNVLTSVKTIFNKIKSSWERIETTCKENKKNKRFLEFFGFKQECLMKKYGFNGEDMYLYAYVRK